MKKLKMVSVTLIMAVMKAEDANAGQFDDAVQDCYIRQEIGKRNQSAQPSWQSEADVQPHLAVEMFVALGL